MFWNAKLRRHSAEFYVTKNDRRSGSRLENYRVYWQPILENEGLRKN